METKKELLEQKKEIESKLANLENSNRVIINKTWDVTDYEDWYDAEYCLEAVKQNGYSLRYVKDQTESICLEAVKEDGHSLRYVKDQTESICLEAVKQNGYSLGYVKDQTESMCLEAVKQNGDSLQYVDKRVFKDE